MLTGLPAPIVENKSSDTSVDSSCVVPIDSESYLAIGPEGQYIVSYERKALPEGFVVAAINDVIKGQRQFVITKDGSDPGIFDDVKVGTLMIHNGYAYISGKVIRGEEPRSNMTLIELPIFVMTYHENDLDGMDDADHFYEVQQENIMEKLWSSIKASVDEKTFDRCFDHNMGRYYIPLDISQKYSCQICLSELTEAGAFFCNDCGDKIGATRGGECGGKFGIVERDEDMDIDEGKDDCEGLTEKLGSTLDIGPSDQAGS